MNPTLRETDELIARYDQLRKYYSELAPEAEPWVHSQLTEEHMNLENRLEEVTKERNDLKEENETLRTDLSYVEDRLRELEETD